jgi:hypothetical protein
MNVNHCGDGFYMDVFTPDLEVPLNGTHCHFLSYDNCRLPLIASAGDRPRLMVDNALETKPAR